MGTLGSFQNFFPLSPAVNVQERAPLRADLVEGAGFRAGEKAGPSPSPTPES